MSAANMKNTRKKSMRFATLGVLGAALALVPAAGALRAQTNPATALNAAKAGAQTAQSSGQNSQAQASGQGTSQAKSQPKPQGTAAKSNAPASQTQSKTPAPATSKPATSNPAPATKPVTKQTETRPNGTYLPKSKTGVIAVNPNHDKPKATPVAAKATPAVPAPQPIAVPKMKSAEPMLKVATVANRRDPFSSLIGREAHGVGHDPVLPPGKAGLQVESLIIQGLVRGPNGMIAVVENPQQRVYFLHEGDSLFDGKVDRITIEGITFHESGKDAFGKPLERDVTKHLNSSLGEQP
jgi:hypothetical protein